jgi:hypothetical protein
MTEYTVDEWSKKKRAIVENSVQLGYTDRRMELFSLYCERQQQIKSLKNLLLVIVVTAWLTWIVLSILF